MLIHQLTERLSFDKDILRKHVDEFASQLLRPGSSMVRWILRVDSDTHSKFLAAKKSKAKDFAISQFGDAIRNKAAPEKMQKFLGKILQKVDTFTDNHLMIDPKGGRNLAIVLDVPSALSDAIVNAGLLTDDSESFFNAIGAALAGAQHKFTIDIGKLIKNKVDREFGKGDIKELADKISNHVIYYHPNPTTLDNIEKDIFRISRAKTPLKSVLADDDDDDDDDYTPRRRTKKNNRGRSNNGASDRAMHVTNIIATLKAFNEKDALPVLVSILKAAGLDAKSGEDKKSMITRLVDVIAG